MLTILSQTEENYLKAIYQLTEKHDILASTNAISEKINTTAASVTDMIKRLATKKLIDYTKSKGVTLTENGIIRARLLIRKHRLWEVFLMEKLKYNWDEVHEIAEQLEHIHSDDLIERLEIFLKFPKFDPHGDPIPDKDGVYTSRNQILLSEMNMGDTGIIVGVLNSTISFLQHLTKTELVLGTQVTIIEINDFDESVVLNANNQTQLISSKVSRNIYVLKG
jgi:DtxR family transcriptional regulator, Mn-dependent transcriptional regulator